MAKKCVKTLMIPTTAGTGAEATPNAIVAVPEKELKVGIVNDAMIADGVILDARMIKSLPGSIAAATGVDALCHAIECFTSKKRNPFSDTFALQAFEMIVKNIEKACDDPGAMEEKSNMLLASFYAGVAITASGTTAVHALSYPLGGKYHIAHGVSNAILLAPVMKFNEPACRARFALAYDRLAPDAGAVTEAEKSAWDAQALSQRAQAWAGSKRPFMAWPSSKPGRTTFRPRSAGIPSGESHRLLPKEMMRPWGSPASNLC